MKAGLEDPERNTYYAIRQHALHFLLANLPARLAPLQSLEAFHECSKRSPLVGDTLSSGFRHTCDFLEHEFERVVRAVALFRQVAGRKWEMRVLNVAITQIRVSDEKRERISADNSPVL